MVEECEFCGNEVQCDAIVDGKYIKVCKRCAKTENIVILQQPTAPQLHDSYKRPTVRQILGRMNGINRAPIQTNKTEFNPYANLRTPSGKGSVRERLEALNAPKQQSPQTIKEAPKDLTPPKITFNKDEMNKEEYLDI